MGIFLNFIFVLTARELQRQPLKEGNIPILVDIEKLFPGPDPSRRVSSGFREVIEQVQGGEKKIRETRYAFR
jgi:hypothetical protein